MDAIVTIFWFLFTIALFPLIYLGGLYLFLWLGLKVLKIEGVPRQKIVVYLFVLFLISIFVFPSLGSLMGENRVINSVGFYLVLLIPSAFVFKYYWRLSNIDLLKFLGWFLIAGAIFSFTISFLLNLSLN